MSEPLERLRRAANRAAERVSEAAAVARGIDREAAVRIGADELRAHALVFSRELVLWPPALALYLPMDVIDSLDEDERRRLEVELAADVADRAAVGAFRTQIAVLIEPDPTLQQTVRAAAYPHVPSRTEVRLVGGHTSAAGKPGGDGAPDYSGDFNEDAWDRAEPASLGMLVDSASLDALQLRRMGGDLLPVISQVVVGRDADGPGCIADPKVSARHCVVRRNDDGLMVDDLGSRNGTWVNGASVEYAALADGDELVVGATRLLASRGGVRDGLTAAETAARERAQGLTDLAAGGWPEGTLAGAPREAYDRLSDAELGTRLLTGWSQLDAAVADLPRHQRSERLGRLEQHTQMPVTALDFARNVRNGWAHPAEQTRPDRPDLVTATAIVEEAAHYL
jgi:hypothetical protein